uniref:Ground-like domain-containing protein n=1 Tax=Acrobeloides nanus TaxID=290746 RepID=A0A914DVV0_9BILA
MIVDVYTRLEMDPKFHICNINVLATQLQKKLEKSFNRTFETIVSFEDFAQKIHFNEDLACKVEIGGKYMLAYGTVRNVAEKINDRMMTLMGPETFEQHNEIRRAPKKNSILI